MRDVSDIKDMRDALMAAIIDLAKAHPEVVFLDSDLSSCINSGPFAKEFPSRFFNCGIAAAYYEYFEVFEECSIAGCAVGNALAGELSFAGASDMLGRSAGSQDDCLSLIFAVVALDGLYGSLKIQVYYCVVYPLAAKLCSLSGESFDE